VTENEGIEKITTMDILNKKTKCTRRKMDGMFLLGEHSKSLVKDLEEDPEGGASLPLPRLL